ncbi:MAG: serine/threonine protein phosphatase [Oscillospiraceae bacterium]|nr:serine/threonine protein phosphatase [Oscillospiraceae bacterium]
MVYVTSDLHGCSVDSFQELLDRAGFADEDYLFILGDVIDRGEYGAELLLWLTEQTNIQLILGNHEAMLLSCDFLFREVTEESLEELSALQLAQLENWIENGGGTTFRGLGKILHEDPELLEGILDYLRDAPLYEQIRVNGRRFVLTHSGLGNFRPEKPLEEYTPHELIWERPGLDVRYFEDATVIFGHTPTELYGMEHQGKALKTPTWICIDTGAAYGGTPMLLRLDDLREFYG